MKLRREREEYFRLVREGYGNKEASGLVGVNQRTGREWRNGRTDPNRFRAPGPASSGRYLRGDERIHIADRLREKATVRSIAAELSRSPSTVSREIRRNRTMDPRGQWHYRPHAAQARADARRPRPKSGQDRDEHRATGRHSSVWPFGGARNRSATLCVHSSPTGRTCTWFTRPSA
ncbi:helix-turn-helix domain-containing protein [Streptomyces sp. Root369]|uniref:helix-turn-helix domain-containing protein n=1 Tax=Streptomyces sp. Root369 TaxID=1736523 RepID=UPI0024129380|nr:helix-turn-helix domain-containing protein [Streptomyces sp. Root369]